MTPKPPPPTGSLVLVPTTLDLGAGADAAPIEDVLGDGVLRAAAHLTHWVAENAKTTRAFLKRVDAVVSLVRPLQELVITELPRAQKGQRGAAPPDLGALLAPARAGHDIGLISEAGLPAVADPGAALVRAAHEEGIPVVVLPGPSALLLALAASGLNGQEFAFFGYLPVDGPARGERIRELEALSRRTGQTQLMIETPYRNAALLRSLLEQLQPATLLSVSSGLTLRGGFTRTAKVAAWRAAPAVLSDTVPAVFAILG